MATRGNRLNAPALRPQSRDVDSLTDPESDDGGIAYFLARIIERGIGPTNHLRVSKSNAAIQGQYALDLSLPLLLDTAFNGIPIKNGQPPNLYLETLGGPITAEVWIIPDVRGKSRQAVLYFNNRSGSVQVAVHCPDDWSGPRPSLIIDIYSHYGDVSVSLPRSFRGDITIQDIDHDCVEFSPALRVCTAPLLDVPEERAYFVRGEPCVEKTRWSRSGEGIKSRSATREEPLDVLRVHGEHNSVWINWVGEADPSKKKPLRIPLNLGRWKSLLNKGGRNVARLFTTSSRAN